MALKALKERRSLAYARVGVNTTIFCNLEQTDGMHLMPYIVPIELWNYRV